MPIEPNINRRAASAKRQNSVTQSEHTVVTQAAYEAIIRGKDTESNLKTKRLCTGKNKIGQAMLIIDGALKDHNPQIEPQSSAIYNALRQVRTHLEKSLLRYPLRIENK